VSKAQRGIPGTAGLHSIEELPQLLLQDAGVRQVSQITRAIKENQQ